jgi:DNA-directed RNA polymerase sigma subunit (sigma70/sigma32)
MYTGIEDRISENVNLGFFKTRMQLKVDVLQMSFNETLFLMMRFGIRTGSKGEELSKISAFLKVDRKEARSIESKAIRKVNIRRRKEDVGPTMIA